MHSPVAAPLNREMKVEVKLSPTIAAQGLSEIKLSELSPSDEQKFYDVLKKTGDYKPTTVDHSRLPQIGGYRVEEKLILNKTHFMKQLWI